MEDINSSEWKLYSHRREGSGKEIGRTLVERSTNDLQAREEFKPRQLILQRGLIRKGIFERVVTVDEHEEVVSKAPRFELTDILAVQKQYSAAANGHHIENPVVSSED